MSLRSENRAVVTSAEQVGFHGLMLRYMQMRPAIDPGHGRIRVGPRITSPLYEGRSFFMYGTFFIHGYNKKMRKLLTGEAFICLKGY